MIEPALTLEKKVAVIERVSCRAAVQSHRRIPDGHMTGSDLLVDGGYTAV